MRLTFAKLIKTSLRDRKELIWYLSLSFFVLGILQMDVFATQVVIKTRKR